MCVCVCVCVSVCLSVCLYMHTYTLSINNPMTLEGSWLPFIHTQAL